MCPSGIPTTGKKAKVKTPIFENFVVTRSVCVHNFRVFTPRNGVRFSALVRSSELGRYNASTTQLENRDEFSDTFDVKITPLHQFFRVTQRNFQQIFLGPPRDAYINYFLACDVDWSGSPINA